MTSLINDSVSLSQVLAAQAGGHLPLETALYACGELARLVATEHEMGRAVTGLDPDHIRCTRAGGVVLTGARVHHPDTRADVHAVGGIFYRLLTGKIPAARDAVAPSRFNPGVDGELDAVILASLATDPSKRPASLRVLEGSLAAVFEELELTASPEGLASVVSMVQRSDERPTLVDIPAFVATHTPVVAPVVAKPVAPVAAKPAAPIAAKPSAPVVAKAAAPVVAKPAAPVAAKPAPVMASKPAPVVAKPAPVIAKPVAAVVAKPAPVHVPKAAAPVARPIIVKHQPPAGWYAIQTIDEDGDDYGEEEGVSVVTEGPSWQAEERERKIMVGVSAAMVLVALLWALWPAPKSNRASFENTPPARVTAQR
jgi:hypothetical protein